MAKQKVPDKKEIFYVGVTDPTEVRRNLLESTRDIVIFLRTYENFKRIRAEKVREIEKLKLQIQEITRILNKLRRDLPKTRLREKAEEIVEKGGRKPVVKISQPRKTEGSDVDRLEQELNAIEEKLKLL
jgi:hypothetical protein